MKSHRSRVGQPRAGSGSAGGSFLSSRRAPSLSGRLGRALYLTTHLLPACQAKAPCSNEVRSFPGSLCPTPLLAGALCRGHQDGPQLGAGTEELHLRLAFSTCKHGSGTKRIRVWKARAAEEAGDAFPCASSVRPLEFIFKMKSAVSISPCFVSNTRSVPGCAGNWGRFTAQTPNRISLSAFKHKLSEDE